MAIQLIPSPSSDQHVGTRAANNGEFEDQF
jgi:hypothetical protein